MCTQREAKLDVKIESSCLHCRGTITILADSESGIPQQGGVPIECRAKDLVRICPVVAQLMGYEEGEYDGE